MGTDIYHWLTASDEATYETIRTLAADPQFGDPDENCPELHGDGCDSNCRELANTQARRILLEASRRHPDAVIEFGAKWYTDDDPEETVYFKSGRLQIAPEVRYTPEFDEAKLEEPRPCAGAIYNDETVFPGGCGKLTGIEECECWRLKWEAERKAAS